MKSGKKVNIRMILMMIAFLIIAVDLIVMNTYQKAGKPVSDGHTFSASEYEGAVMIADGGYGQTVPENTIPAIENAASNHYQYIKLDLRLTRDKQWVCAREQDISSFTDGEGLISDYTYYQLLNYSIQYNKKKADYGVLSVPTAEDALKACQNLGLTPVLELHDYDEKSADTLIHLLTALDMKYTAVILSQNQSYLLDMNTKLGTLQYWFKIDELNEETIGNARKTAGFKICFNASNKKNDENALRILDEYKLTYACYHVKKPDTVQKFYELGVREFLTASVAP